MKGYVFRTAKIMILNNYPNIIIDRIAPAICFSKNASFFTNGLLKPTRPFYTGQTGL